MILNKMCRHTFIDIFNFLYRIMINIKVYFLYINIHYLYLCAHTFTGITN